MKKEEINPVDLEVRQLSKKFKKMGKAAKYMSRDWRSERI